MSGIDEVIARFKILFVIVASVDGARWEEFGDRNKVFYRGLLEQYFSGPEGMPALDELLREQPLPQVVSQGNLICVLCKPLPQLIVGLFANAPGDVMKSIIWSEELEEAVRGTFASDCVEVS